MNKWFARTARFLREEDGPTAVEYAVMLAFIITVCFATIQTLGGTVNSKFDNADLKTALTGS